jgi:hypothetical protein
MRGYQVIPADIGPTYVIPAGLPDGHFDSDGIPCPTASAGEPDRQILKI